MARGRPRKWSHASPAHAQQTVADQWEKDAREYRAFGKKHKLSMGPDLLLLYSNSQSNAGLCPVAIANRVESFRHLTDNNFDTALKQHHVSREISRLRKEKANAGGPKRKQLVRRAVLCVFLSVTPTTHRDLWYQVLWYVCCATGCRPEETRTLKYKWRNGDLYVRWCGRKNEAASGAAYIKFQRDLFGPPPPLVEKWLASGKALPSFGPVENLATNINSWLKKFCGRYHIPQPDAHITSTVPRVRMDNILRAAVDSGKLPVHVYEQMIGHSIKVSDISYRR